MGSGSPGHSLGTADGESAGHVDANVPSPVSDGGGDGGAPTTAPTTTTTTTTTTTLTPFTWGPCGNGVQGAVCASVEPGNRFLPRSTNSSLITLTKSMPGQDTRWPVECARSYQGFAWELTQPPDFALAPTSPRVLKCTRSLCHVSLPRDSGHEYKLTRYSTDHAAHAHGSDRYARMAAKLLTQATFVPTLAGVRNLSALLRATGAEGFDKVHRDWLYGQMALPASLHRAYYRRRANPRLSASVAAGTVRSACDKGSRWHRFWLRSLDIGHEVVFRHESGVTVLRVDGLLRSEAAFESVHDTRVDYSLYIAHTYKGDRNPNANPLILGKYTLSAKPRNGLAAVSPLPSRASRSKATSSRW